MTLADRVMLMRDGDIQQIGAPMAHHERPANILVACFIGSPEMNFLNGAVDARDDRLVVRLSDGGELPLPALAAAAVEPGQAVVLGIRPEHLSIGQGGIAARAGEQDMTCVLYGAASSALDEAIVLTPDAARVHVFDAGTERRVG